MNEYIAIIPARGGSERIKNKNLTKISGKSLLQRAIEAANNANFFSRVIVNSEDPEIILEAGNHGIETYNRPIELASSSASVIDVIKEMILQLSFDPAARVFVLLPTAPLRESIDLIEMKNVYDRQSDEKKALVSVSEFDTPIQLAQNIKDNELNPVFERAYKKSTKSTAHEKTYRFNECAVINSAQGFLGQENLIGTKSIPYLMPSEKSIAIDNSFQKKLVELLLNEK